MPTFLQGAEESLSARERGVGGFNQAGVSYYFALENFREGPLKSPLVDPKKRVP